MHNQVFVAAVLAALLSVDADAASILVSTDCGLGNVRRESTTDVASGARVESRCLFADSIDSVNDLAIASAVFDTQLSLGTYAAADTTLGAGPSGLGADFITARVTFTDTVVPTGGVTGTAGTIVLIFPISGSTAVTTFPSSGASFYEAALSASVSGASSPSERAQEFLDGAAVIQFSLPIIFGAETTLTFTMYSDIALFNGIAGSAADLVLDYLNTATLQQVTLLDSNGALIPDGQLVSLSGLSYPTASVPEPASVLLMATAAFGVLVGRRRRLPSSGRQDEHSCVS